MTHREAIKEWLCKIRLVDAHVVDWGRGTKPAIRYIDPTSVVASYFGIDKLEHVDADLVCDITEPWILERNYDVAFCIEVLEHVSSPVDVLKNIASNLKEGGVLYLSAPFMFPVHSEEDFWRFTDQGLIKLLSEVGFVGDTFDETPDHQGWMVTAHKQ